jgi:class 3 adenylate cyclase
MPVHERLGPEYPACGLSCGARVSAAAPAPQWLATTLRWGPAEIPLQSNSRPVLSWTRDCFTAELPAPPGPVAPAAAAVVVDDELARRLADACREPVPGTEMPAQSGAAEGMLLVRPVTEVISRRRPVDRSWPELIVFGLAPDGDWYAVTTGDPLAPRAGELLARQLLERHLREAGAATLHAAGAVLDGQAVLFAGDSGCGKTTLAAWAAARLGGYFLSGDKAGAYVSGGTAMAVGLAQPTRFGEGTLRSLLGEQWWQEKLPLPQLNQMMGTDKAGQVAPGPFKVVLSNAELGGLGVRAASAAPLAALVLAAAGPAGEPAEVRRVPPGEALALVRPQLRSSWDLLPFGAGEPAERRFGAADGALASVLERVPVLVARWRPGHHDPAGVIEAVRDELS